ncbi:Pex19 protein [Naematelia encephala]|uniref:Pex19 protein n=1 Tax=Naematelia encephala TaxID=71784 RepID=A0A1Y2AP86_9TREE|nr:Pex19 protein [Naematelia encephala]
MSAGPSSSKSYREPTVEDDDEDLDDLDDVLASFNKPSAAAPSIPEPPSKRATEKSPAAVDDEDFEASLVEGMETLLRQLAGDHPPGPMPDEAVSPVSSSSNHEGDLSKEEEEDAWQRAVEAMLSGEGLEALGLNENGDKARPDVARKGKVNGESRSKTSQDAKPDFDETIRRTMESLRAPKAGSSESDSKPDLAALLAQLGAGAGAGNGDLPGDDDDFGGLLDGMMASLMTREVLEEPMSELASKYPAYLASPPAGTSSADIKTYTAQHVLVDQIVATFRKPGYSDEQDGKEIARLVGEMQDLGGPPKEIMGELPEGFDLGSLGALGGDEGCNIM